MQVCAAVRSNGYDAWDGDSSTAVLPCTNTTTALFEPMLLVLNTNESHKGKCNPKHLGCRESQRHRQQPKRSQHIAHALPAEELHVYSPACVCVGGELLLWVYIGPPRNKLISAHRERESGSVCGRPGGLPLFLQLTYVRRELSKYVGQNMTPQKIEKNAARLQEEGTASERRASDAHLRTTYDIAVSRHLCRGACVVVVSYGSESHDDELSRG